jgi:hypothetical protein
MEQMLSFLTDTKMRRLSRAVNGKKIGTVKSIDSNSLVVFKKGPIRNEEFHIPTIAVSHYVSRSGKDIEASMVGEIVVS